jgi:hypothetical protein
LEEIKQIKKSNTSKYSKKALELTKQSFFDIVFP